jgi:protein-disulfide isomerase
MVLADFQCPYCASFHTTLKAIQKHYPRDVAVTFMHHPLLMHSHAEAAARAAECAAEQDRFSAMHDYMFENQGALGKTPWIELARAAGVADSSQFDACMTSSPVVDARIQAHKNLGDKTFAIRATPTLIINGWKLSEPPDHAALNKMVEAALAGKAPVGKKNFWSMLSNAP